MSPTSANRPQVGSEGNSKKIDSKANFVAFIIRKALMFAGGMGDGIALAVC